MIWFESCVVQPQAYAPGTECHLPVKSEANDRMRQRRGGSVIDHLID